MGTVSISFMSVTTSFNILIFYTCRSVHNSRIERLWYDVTRGFGKKWKDFFQSLQAHYDLNPAIRTHKWLISFLFLEGVNIDAQKWVGMWNEHRMSVAGD